MKQLITVLIAIAGTLSASALIDGDGYYRAHNYMTGRYIYVLDDKGELNFQATTAELGAIELWKDLDRAISDPATIIYVKDLDGKKRTFDLQTQGTGVKTIIDYPVTIYLYKNINAYSVYGSNSGMVRYIGDATISNINADRGYVTSMGNGNNYRWHFDPVTTTDDNYFGVAPEFLSDGSYYASMYADFPFSCHSSGLTAHYVSIVADGVAYLSDIKGTVPKGTPVIFKCSSSAPSGNRLSIGGEGSPITNNQLKGVYFNNTSLLHKNLTPNDKATMRVLGLLPNGEIGFVTSDEEYLPRNKAYLVVPAGTPAELKIDFTTHASITDVAADAISISLDGLELSVDGASETSVYNITGRLITHSANANSHAISLPAPGIYIVKADSKVAKIIAR